MRAIVQERYGSAEVLKNGEISKPEIGSDEVLVRVHAASVHVGDWVLMTGQPWPMRLATGLRKPRNRIPGTDVAGTIEAIGSDVHRLHDEVFGWSPGAFAEYAAASDQFIAKPANLTFEEAAAVGVSASTALLLRDNGKVRPGQQVLINGASGGRHVRGADRQGPRCRGDRGRQYEERRYGPIDRGRPRDRLHPRGLHDGDLRYDLILDNVGNHSMARTRRVLRRGGTLISNGGGHTDGKLLRTVRTMLVSMFVREQAKPTVKTQNRADLIVLKEVEAGQITPVIGGTYPLDRTRQAIERVAGGHARGTLVISMSREGVARPASPNPMILAGSAA